MERHADAKGKEQHRRVSAKSKNERFWDMLLQARANHVRYRFVVADSWFASKETMTLIKKELGKDFVMPLKSNRKVALSLKDKQTAAGSKWTRSIARRAPPKKSGWKEWTSRSVWSGRSLQTNTAQRQYSNW